MSPQEFEQKVQSLLRKQPFQPFVIELTDGERLVVGVPEALWYHEGGTGVYLREDGSLDFVNCEAVSRLVELIPAATTGS